MVELAITLPLLCSMLFAIAEFSMLFLNYQALTTASREGARSATLFRTNCNASVGAAVQLAVSDALANSQVRDATHTLSGACTPGGRSTVTVRSTYRFLILPGFLDSLGFRSLQLTATSVMQNESTGT